MTPNFEFEPVKKAINENDEIHINPTNGTISGYLNVLNFVDKDTKQQVCYIPSLDISGYGSTKDRAIEILKENLYSFLTELLNSTLKKASTELIELGWKKDRYRNKDFSKSFVDQSGNLQNFNAEDKIERFALVA